MRFPRKFHIKENNLYYRMSSTVLPRKHAASRLGKPFIKKVSCVEDESKWAISYKDRATTYIILDKN